MAIKNIKIPGTDETVPVGTQTFPGTRDEWNALSREEKIKWDYTAFDDDDDDVPEDLWAKGVDEKLGKALYNHGEQSVDKDFTLVFDDVPDGGIKFVGGTIKGFQPGVGWIPDDGYDYPDQVPDVPMVKKAIDAETTPYAKLFHGNLGITPPTSTTAKDNVGVKVGTYRIMVSNGGSFRIFKCTKIEGETITWTPQGGVHKPTMYRLNEDGMSGLGTVQAWCEWIYNHITVTNDGDYMGSVGHLEFYHDDIKFSNTVEYVGYMTCYLTRATDWGGNYCLHGFGIDDAGNVFKIYGTDYDEVDPESAKLYAEKMVSQADLNKVTSKTLTLSNNPNYKANNLYGYTVNKVTTLTFEIVCVSPLNTDNALITGAPIAAQPSWGGNIHFNLEAWGGTGVPLTCFLAPATGKICLRGGTAGLTYVGSVTYVSQ